MVITFPFCDLFASSCAKIFVRESQFFFVLTM